jgi:chemotaxis response regulator CheB
MSSPSTLRVIAAVSADVQPRLRAVLRGFELRFVQSGSELVRALDEAQCDLMVVEVNYDESAAVAALKCVLSREATFPVVCVRNVPFAKLRHAVLDALRTALGAVGAHDFIDLLDYSADDSGNARVRAILERHLPGGR